MNKKPVFNRKAWYGLNFHWCATDAVGNLAIFWSGYGEIPNIIFEFNENDFTNYRELVLASGHSSEAELSKNNRKLEQLESYDFSSYLDYARMGLFVFDEGEKQGELYELQAIPKNPLNLGQLPNKSKTYFDLLKFVNLECSTTETIVVSEYFAVAK